MSFYEHKNRFIIKTSKPAETTIKIKECIDKDMKYIFPNNFAVGDDKVVFSRTIFNPFWHWDRFCAITDGEIMFKEHKSSITLFYRASLWRLIIWDFLGLLFFIAFGILESLSLSFILVAVMLLFVHFIILLISSTFKFDSLIEKSIILSGGTIMKA